MTTVRRQQGDEEWTMRASVRLGTRATSMLVAVGVAGLVCAASAMAHVTVSAPGAESGGGDQVITFRVPTESATASTTGLTVKLPTDTPIASVLVAPHTGWTDKVTTTNLSTPIKTDDGEITDAVSSIRWSADADADGIKPGQFDQFVIIAGQLPEAKSLTFRAIQDYSDGSTVSWIETAAPGSTEGPDHPAPVLSLAAASGQSDSVGSGSAGQAPATSQATVTVAASTDTASSGSATTGIVLGAIGVVLGAAALFVALRRRGSVASHG